MKISTDELRKLTAAALRNQGYNEDEIPIICEILLYAQLRGNNQVIRSARTRVSRKIPGQSPATQVFSQVNAIPVRYGRIP